MRSVNMNGLAMRRWIGGSLIAVAMIISFFGQGARDPKGVGAKPFSYEVHSEDRSSHMVVWVSNPQPLWMTVLVLSLAVAGVVLLVLPERAKPAP